MPLQSAARQIAHPSAMIDSLPIKVLADNPVAQPTKLILIVVQFVVVLKQKLSKLCSDFEDGMLVAQGHKRPGATTIFNRCPSFSCQTDRIGMHWIKVKNLLQANLMLPAIGQIILVDPALFAAEMKIAELHLMRIVTEADPSWFPDPIRFPSNNELMEVLISPAKSDLKRVMELGNGAVAAYQKATPDLRTDFSYPDAQLIHLHCLVRTAHALPLLQ